MMYPHEKRTMTRVWQCHASRASFASPAPTIGACRGLNLPSIPIGRPGQVSDPTLTKRGNADEVLRFSASPPDQVRGRLRPLPSMERRYLRAPQACRGAKPLCVSFHPPRLGDNGVEPAH